MQEHEQVADDFEVVVDQAPAPAHAPLDLDDEDHAISYDEWNRLFPADGDPKSYKHDVYGLTVKAVLGFGVGAGFVNQVVKHNDITSPIWLIAPVVLSAATLTHGFLENKNVDWQRKHAKGMRVYTYVVAGIKVTGLWVFNQGVLTQYWQGDVNTVAVRIAIPVIAVGMSVPFVLLDQRENLAQAQCMHPRMQAFLKHNGTKKTIAALNYFLNGNAGTSAVLGFTAALVYVPAHDLNAMALQNITNATMNNVTVVRLISAFDVSMISAGVGVGNMAAEILASWEHPIISLTSYGVGALRIVVAAGAMGTQVVSVGFNFTSGILGGVVTIPAAATIGGVVGTVIVGVTAYRLKNYLVNPFPEAEEEGQPAVIRTHPIRETLRFFANACGRCRREPAATRLLAAEEGQPEQEERPDPQSSRCTIL